MNIIFLISLPRPGSTLLQSILASHPQIRSHSEPWMALPLVYSFAENKRSISEFNSYTGKRATNNFIQSLESNNVDFYSKVREFLLSCYSGISESSDYSYFLDKTPRYYLIIEELLKIFPGAKYIFLFRNPIRIISSIINTWNKNSFVNINNNLIDLVKGPEYMVKGMKKLGDNAISVAYEKLVEHPKETVKKICGFIDIKYLDDLTEYFDKVALSGPMGDTKINGTNRIENYGINESDEKLNFIKRRFYQKTINRIPREFYQILDSNKEDVLLQLNGMKKSYRGNIQDLFHIMKNAYKRKLKTNILFEFKDTYLN